MAARDLLLSLEKSIGHSITVLTPYFSNFAFFYRHSILRSAALSAFVLRIQGGYRHFYFPFFDLPADDPPNLYVSGCRALPGNFSLDIMAQLH